MQTHARKSKIASLPLWHAFAIHKNTLDSPRNLYTSCKSKSYTIMFHLKVLTATSNQRRTKNELVSSTTVNYGPQLQPGCAVTAPHYILRHTRDQLLTNQGKFVLALQVAEDASWQPNITTDAMGGFICRISLVVFFWQFTKLISTVHQRYKCWCVKFHLTPAGLRGSWHIIKQKSRRMA